MPSKNPQVRAIELEASRRAAADGTTSHKERFAIRKALRADAGLGKEQKQRGGVAGAYDRNKAYVLPVAAALAGLTGVGGRSPRPSSVPSRASTVRARAASALM